VPDSGNPAVQHPLQALQDELHSGAESLGVMLDLQQQQQMLDYLELLSRWNKVTNLTAVRSVDEMVSRHLLDSIAILPVVREVLASTANKTESDNSPHVLDIGSGAGLPGIPLAIADRGIDVMMIDSAARKTRFVQQAIADLGLGNASVLHSRVQDADLPLFPCLVARAFASPVDILSSSGFLCEPGGVYVLMMGHTLDKLDQLPDEFTLQAVRRIEIPGHTVTRHVALCKRSSCV